MDFTGANVLVTGATGGLGQVIAGELAARGAQVVVTGRRSDVLGPLAERIGGRAIVADLADRASVTELLAAAGDLDVVIANAAVPGSGALQEYSIEDIDRALDVNLRAPIMLARLAAERLIERRSGHLVFVNSLSGKSASGLTTMYNATKFGLRGFALALREELRPHGVGVSSIFPGFISDAGMFADTEVTLPRGIGTKTPRDVAAAVVKAVEKNVAEIDVAPLPMRLGARIAGAAPALSATVQRWGGAATIARDMSVRQVGKR